MRHSVGVDIVSVPRIERLLTDHPGAAAEIFTDAERAYCAGKRRSFDHLAARFAAKEAVLKALGTGLGPSDRWTDVEIRSDPVGPPRVLLHGDPARRMTELGGTTAISLSHSGDYAIAHAVVLIP